MRKKKLLTPKQPTIYTDLRKIGATPSLRAKAEEWVAKRVTTRGNIRRKRK